MANKVEHLVWEVEIFCKISRVAPCHFYSTNLWQTRKSTYPTAKSSLRPKNCCNLLPNCIITTLSNLCPSWSNRSTSSIRTINNRTRWLIRITVDHHHLINSLLQQRLRMLKPMQIQRQLTRFACEKVRQIIRYRSIRGKVEFPDATHRNKLRACKIRKANHSNVQVSINHDIDISLNDKVL